MKRFVSSLAAIALCLGLFACDSTRIEKNPGPITWGEITFAPETIERSKGKTVWNNVAVSGYGHEGVIGKVVITDDETTVENLRSDIFSAKKQVFKKVSGAYEEALQVLLSPTGAIGGPGQKLASLPKFSIGEYEIAEGRWQDKQIDNTIARGKGRNISFSTLSDWEAENIITQMPDGVEAQMGSVSIKKLFLPDDFGEHPENIILEDLNIRDIQVPGEKIKVEKIYADYKDFALKFSVDNAVVPGEALEDLNLKSVPETLEGSLKGEGKVADGMYEAEASLDLKGLLDLQGKAKGLLQGEIPEVVTFELQDRGILKYVTSEEKAQLMMLTMFVQDAQEPVMRFLTNPGQTLMGSLHFDNGRPVISIKVK